MFAGNGLFNPSSLNPCGLSPVPLTRLRVFRIPSGLEEGNERPLLRRRESHVPYTEACADVLPPLPEESLEEAARRRSDRRRTCSQPLEFRSPRTRF
jgi:hypothetical protein